MWLTLSLFFCAACWAIGSQLVLRADPAILIVVFLIRAHTQATIYCLIAFLFSPTRKTTLIVCFFVAVSAIVGSLSDQIFSDGVPFAWFIHPSFALFNLRFTGIRHLSRVNGFDPSLWKDFTPGTTMFRLHDDPHWRVYLLCHLGSVTT